MRFRKNRTSCIISLQTDSPMMPSRLTVADLGFKRCEHGWYRLPTGDGLPVTLPITSIQIGGRLFPITGYDLGQGENPWHTIQMVPSVAAELEEYLQEQGYRLPLTELMDEA